MAVEILTDFFDSCVVLSPAQIDGAGLSFNSFPVATGKYPRSGG